MSAANIPCINRNSLRFLSFFLDLYIIHKNKIKGRLLERDTYYGIYGTWSVPGGPVAIHQLPVAVDVDCVPAVIGRPLADGWAWPIIHTFCPATQGHAMQSCIPGYKKIIETSIDICVHINEKINFHKPSFLSKDYNSCKATRCSVGEFQSCILSVNF